MNSEQVDVVITTEVFYDLGLWLSEPDRHSAAQLTRLQNENTYLPLIALANRYWLIGRLTDQLSQSNVWPLLPEQLTDYLTVITDHYQQRNERLKLEATYITPFLADAGIQVMLLKSSAGLFNGLFTPLCRRFMYDIDLLVPEEYLAKSVELLKTLGYEEDPNELAIDPVGHQHAPPLKKENSPCFIELHRWPLPYSVQSVLTTHEIWQHTKPLFNLCDNKNIVELSATYQVILTIAHSELADRGYQENHIELRQLTYLYDLINHNESAIDWHLVEHHFYRANQLNALQMCLYQLQELFNLKTPINALKNPLNKTLARQFQDNLILFEKTQGQPSVWQNIYYILSHYKTASVIDIYGNNGRFPVATGRVKLLTHHLKLAMNIRYLSAVFRRIFNKNA